MTLADFWVTFADTQCRDYSPLYDRIVRYVATLDEIMAMVQAAPPEAHMPNVLLAAVHFVVLGGVDHPLVAVYESASDADPGPLFADVCVQYRTEIEHLLATRHTNTNEVGRSAVLGPALLTVAERLGAPLGLVDVGCSAGLNLLCDRYFLDYGEFGATGPTDADVRLQCEVIGGRPPTADTLPAIGSRVGLDLDPVDLSNDDDARWQLACVWPDTGRLPRTRIAIGAARGAGLQIVQGDAVDGVADVVRSVPSDCLPVVVTTWALAYLPPDRRALFDAALVDLGHERPIAWISGEGPTVVPRFADVDAPTDHMGTVGSLLGLVTYDGEDVDATLLAYVHPHGTWIDWLA
jgi:hypothetical protein